MHIMYYSPDENPAASGPSSGPSDDSVVSRPPHSGKNEKDVPPGVISTLPDDIAAQKPPKVNGEV